MPLTIPQLDDRSYQDLLDDALASIRQDLDTDWNDLSAGDPGVVLLEAFAFLTEQMLYRLNRLPEKAYVAFLNLLGVSLYPPSAAEASLHFWQSGSETIVLPRGTLIVPGGGSDDKLANAFVLAEDVKVPATSRDEAMAVQATAYHCEQIEEGLGVSNGLPGQSFSVQRPPLIAPLKDWLNPVVGIEVTPEEQQPGDKEGADGRLYRPWQEVERFSRRSPNTRQSYTVDRVLGIIQFAPAIRRKPATTGQETSKLPDPALPIQRQAVTTLGEIPVGGRHIRIWYSRGGGEAGNLPAGTLTEILNPSGEWLAAGVNVTNPKPAWGGADGETLANALVRGPHDFFANGNVVTARDYEALVLGRSRSMARVKAYARRALWTYAQPGTVEIVLLPRLPADQRETVSLKALRAGERVADLVPILRELDARKPLGTRCELVWPRYKKVTIDADLLIKSKGGSNIDPREERIREALYRLLSPFALEAPKRGSPANDPAAGISHEGWPFGQELRLAQIYQQILSTERDVSLIRRLAVKIEEAPDRDIRCLAADSFQPNTWYAASAERLFRSTNNGQGWEKVLAFAGKDDAAGRLYESSRPDGDQIWIETEKRGRESVMVVCPATTPGWSGVVAVATRLEDGGAALYATANCGETWYRLVSHFDGMIEDMAWLPRGNSHVLLLATSCGLYELDLVFRSGGEPELIPDGKPPSDPAPDENAEIMLRLVPVDPDRPTLALYAVAVIARKGNGRVAVAARNRQGVYLSQSDDLIKVAKKADGKISSKDESENARSNFAYLGLRGEDVRHLNVQKYKDHTFLWAGAMAVGDVGHGCYRWQFYENLQEGDIVAVYENWTGGSCHALAFQGPKVLAATAWGGILSADFNPDNWEDVPGWTQMDRVDNLLPQRIRNLEEEADSGNDDLTRRDYAPLIALASNDSAGSINEQPILMTGGATGVYRALMEKDGLEILLQAILESGAALQAHIRSTAKGNAPSEEYKRKLETLLGAASEAMSELTKHLSSAGVAQALSAGYKKQLETLLKAASDDMSELQAHINSTGKDLDRQDYKKRLEVLVKATISSSVDLASHIKSASRQTFEKVSRTEFLNLRDVVTLPPNWLFVSGDHTVKIGYEDAQLND